MQSHDHDDNKPQHEPIRASIELVDREDLHAAFGGEGLPAAALAQAQPAPSTLMCPGW